MITKEKEDLYWLIVVIMFITGTLLGSFVVSRNILDLCYLVVLYAVIFIRVVILK